MKKIILFILVSIFVIAPLTTFAYGDGIMLSPAVILSGSHRSSGGGGQVLGAFTSSIDETKKNEIRQQLINVMSKLVSLLRLQLAAVETSNN